MDHLNPDWPQCRESTSQRAQRNLIQCGIVMAKAGQTESEARTQYGVRALRVRRLGMTNHSLHAGERATESAFDVIDIVVHPEHAHRRRGAAMEVDDLAGFGVAHAH